MNKKINIGNYYSLFDGKDSRFTLIKRDRQMF